MSVTSTDLDILKREECMHPDPKTPEDFCLGCWRAEYFPGDEIDPPEWNCPWCLNPEICPRAEEYFEILE